MTTKLTLLAILLFPIFVLANDSDPYQSALEELKSNPEAQVSVQDGWTVVQVPGVSPYAIWSFTPENHPAHPVFAKRTVVQSETGAWHVETKMSCGASKIECDKLMLEYEALDEKMKNELSKDKNT